MNILPFNSILFIASGVGITLLYTLISFSVGLCLGTVLSTVRSNKFANSIIRHFISLIRGTPLILQLSFFYFAIPNVLGIRINILTAGILTFSLNSTAYITEILRGGIQSLPKGQFEASQTLEIPNFLMWKDIIFPQVFRNVFPSLMNEFITLIKETALISVLGEMDIMRRAQTVAAQQFSYFGPLCIAGLSYYGVISFFEYLGHTYERRYGHVRRS